MKFSDFRHIPMLEPVEGAQVYRARPNRAEMTAALDGIATRFGVLCRGGADFSDGEHRHCFFVFAPRCFDASLRKIAAGEQRFKLLFAHNHGDVLLDKSETARCVTLKRRGSILQLTIHPRTAAGRAALAVIRASGHTGLSVGADRIRSMRAEVDAGKFLIITKARLTEVSVAPLGGCPGAQLLF